MDKGTLKWLKVINACLHKSQTNIAPQFLPSLKFFKYIKIVVLYSSFISTYATVNDNSFMTGRLYDVNTPWECNYWRHQIELAQVDEKILSHLLRHPRVMLVIFVAATTQLISIENKWNGQPISFLWSIQRLDAEGFDMLTRTMSKRWGC